MVLNIFLQKIGPNLTEGPAATWDFRQSTKEEAKNRRSFKLMLIFVKKIAFQHWFLRNTLNLSQKIVIITSTPGWEANPGSFRFCHCSTAELKLKVACIKFFTLV
jgi:hypothetical protein